MERDRRQLTRSVYAGIGDFDILDSRTVIVVRNEDHQRW